jgi:hypothetical protein
MCCRVHLVLNRRFGGMYRLHFQGDGGDTFLRNVGSHKIYTAPHPSWRHSSYLHCIHIFPSQMQFIVLPTSLSLHVSVLCSHQNCSTVLSRVREVFACLIRRVLDWMIGFIAPYNSQLSGLRIIQRYRYSTHFPVRRSTRTRILSLH